MAGGDEAHVPAHRDMEGCWKRPLAGMGWYRDVQGTFAALPEE